MRLLQEFRQTSPAPGGRWLRRGRRTDRPELSCPAPTVGGVPTLEMLRQEVKKGRVPVLLFGWYKKDKDTNKITRSGGHYVALAGYNVDKKDTFYVTNPLVDYSKKSHTYSKIALAWQSYELNTADQETRDRARPRMLFTDDLVGGHFALLESIIIVSPE